MKKDLEIFLEKLQIFKNPKIQLEQYPTPAPLAAHLASFAKVYEDESISFADLGCGTGILSIAFSIAGFNVFGVDIDREALIIARKNAEISRVSVDFILQDVRDLALKYKVGVVMNPPFGIQRRHADRIFLEKAFEIGDVIYSIHSAGSEKLIRAMCSENGFHITHLWRFRIPLKKLYWFHEKQYKLINVEVYRMERV